MTRVPTSFRTFCLTLTVAAWLAVLYLASHGSQSPAVLGRYSWAYFVMLCGVVVFAVVVSVLSGGAGLRRAYDFRYCFVLLVASTLLGLGIAEAIVRFTDPFGISYYEANARHRRYRIDDPDLIYRLKPLVQITSRRGDVVRYNEYGLRDNPIQTKQASEFRILALGDSVTYGSGVAQDAIYTVRLQRLLGEKLNRPVRVINAGVGGYDTVQEFTYLKKEGLSFKPDLVTLMYVSNDIEINKRPSNSRSSSLTRTAREVIQQALGRSWLYRLLIHAHRMNRFSTRPPVSIESERASEGWHASMKALKGIVETCEKEGIPLVVFFWRWNDNPFSDALMADVKTAVAPAAVYDVGEWFAAKPIEKYFNSRVDSHPNSEGHRVLAENMAAKLLEREFVPPSAAKIVRVDH